MNSETNLFVIDLEYRVSIEVVEPHLDAHIAFLEHCYATGVFLASGRKVPRTGGVILARGQSKSEIETLVAGDPFHQHELAHYTITEFVPSMTAPSLQL
ncbi:YciI family protein [Roseibium algae]|uniref:YciI family protein n=1 Tax=Roseibium algae TaxID=3123038 RepID=A0ABU8TSC5_9HYPH